MGLMVAEIGFQHRLEVSGEGVGGVLPGGMVGDSLHTQQVANLVLLPAPSFAGTSVCTPMG